MGFKTFGFAGGREDVWEPDEDVYWGPRPRGSARSSATFEACAQCVGQGLRSKMPNANLRAVVVTPWKSTPETPAEARWLRC
nr:hypothetical protein [Saccharopolyspora pogona]